MLKNFFKIRLIFICLPFFLFTCSSGYVYQIPEQTEDGWETAHLADVGINPAYLVDLMNRIETYHRIHSILIVRYNKLVFEEYFHGVAHPIQGDEEIDFDRETLQVLSSVTKSYTSALLGIAIDKGYIQDLDQKVFDFFPELAHLNVGQKEQMTIKHMITMSSGLHWDQTTYPILDSRNDIAQMQNAENPWAMYLSRPLDSVPGQEFLYSEGSINVVGEIIKRTSGLHLDRFAEQFLFTPLDISQFHWFLVRPDIGWIWASGDLRQRSRDMAKFGQLYLQKGLWNGSAIVSEEWVNASAKRYFTFSPPYESLDLGMDGYGYAWWIRNSDYGRGAFCAWGWGEQYIIVVPDFDLVVVFTGGSYYNYPLLSSHDIMIQYILPAIQ